MQKKCKDLQWNVVMKDCKSIATTFKKNDFKRSAEEECGSETLNQSAHCRAAIETAQQADTEKTLSNEWA